MRIKYNRTSTLLQDGKRFELDKDLYDLTLFDKGVSGSVPFSERKNGKKIIDLVLEGKVNEIVVEEISRVGRHTHDCLNTLKFFEDNNVNVVIRGMGNLQSMINGEKNPIWNLITSVMSSLYEMERDNIKERTMNGREVYKLKGGVLGRKYGSVEDRNTFLQKEKTQQIMKLLKMGKSVRDISGRVGCSGKLVTKVRKYMMTEV
jgi:DNA invertase Pin-like site-specific DNA recombinase